MQVEIDIVAEEWSIKPLCLICSMKSGESITNAYISDSEKYPCFGGNGLRGYTNRYTHDGSFCLIGRQGALCGNVLGVIGKFFASEHAIVVTASKDIDINFLTHVLKRMNLNQYTESSAQPGLSINKLLPLPILLPPTKAEQTAIANVLSDADAWIQSLTRLIEKKRQIKQGAIQALLNPYENGRLKKGWAVMKLNDVAMIRDGTHQTPKYVDSGIPFYSVENVTRNDFINTKFISENEHKLLSKNCKLEKGDILMTRIGSIGDCKLIDWNVNASFYVSLALIRLKKSINSRYFLQFSKTHFFQKELENNSLQFAIPKKINLGQIENVLMAMPCNIKEQVLIGDLLFRMDDEIRALESKLAKAQQIKQGMMQNLLTGRIRLV